MITETPAPPDRQQVVDMLFRHREPRSLDERVLLFCSQMWWDYRVLKMPVWKVAHRHKVGKQEVLRSVGYIEVVLDELGGWRDIAVREIKTNRDLLRLSKKQLEYVRRVIAPEWKKIDQLSMWASHKNPYACI